MHDGHGKLTHYLHTIASAVVDWRLWMLALAFIAVVNALVHPKVALEREFFRYVFTFDITQSMNVRDAGTLAEPQTRLEFAKHAAIRSLHEMPCGSEIGIAIFTQYRSFLLFTPVEICEHFGEISQMIGEISWRMAWRSRSEIAKGIHSAIQLTGLIDNPTNLVFFTDGHEAPPVNPDLKPVLKAKPVEVNGAIIGVGGFSSSPIPKLDADGNVEAFWKAGEVMQVDVYSYGRITGASHEPMVGIDNSDLKAKIQAGQEHLSSLHEAYLIELAEETDVNYHRLTGVDKLAEFLTQAKFAQKKSILSDLHWLFGLAALLLILAIYVPGIRSKQV